MRPLGEKEKFVMVCRCGYQNEPDDFYCAQCGRKLSKRNRKGWIIAIVVVLLLLVDEIALLFDRICTVFGF